MQIHTSNAVSLVAVELTTSLAKIYQDVGTTPESFAGELIQSGLRPSGPMMFLYEGLTEDIDKEFKMQITLPVSAEDAERYSGANKVKRLEPFQFVEIVLHGDIKRLSDKAYAPIMEQIAKEGLVPTGFSREVYQNFVDPSSADNETRVQIGVVANKAQ